MSEVSEGMLDEAIRLGSLSAEQANRYMRLSNELMTAINEALRLLECGRTDKARDILLNIKKAAIKQILDSK